MNKSIQNLESTNQIKRHKNNVRDGLGAGAVLFVALLIGAAPQANPNHPVTRDFIWAGVSYIGVLALLLVAYLSYRRADERQQLVQLKATALTFLMVLLGLFTTEMLYALKQINLNPVIQILFIGSIVLWTVIQKIIERRSL